MALPLSSPDELPAALSARRTGRLVVVAGGAIAVLVLVAALALWFRYGTAVFFETIAAGVAGCF
ncbi:hypothetical protein [Bradyrhizobium sp. ARR65]|uniref:hypothetical protein n=1 Tax=Bradyrhizobium sp. ARR65 TaxID=1040989 RepID=UPI000464319F|nr:hypothetical protein [Bradyrhizobium sp. ARR65]